MAPTYPGRSQQQASSLDRQELFIQTVKFELNPLEGINGVSYLSHAFPHELQHRLLTSGWLVPGGCDRWLT